jgi:hypothetical protein
VDFSLKDVLPTTRVYGMSGKKIAVERYPDWAADAIACDISGRVITNIQKRNGVCFFTTANHTIIQKKISSDNSAAYRFYLYFRAHWSTLRLSS